MYNNDTIDAINIVSFLLGVANYKENLTQSDKDDIIKSLDRQTKDILTRVQEALEEQNVMLRRSLDLLEGKKNGLYECFHCGQRAVGWQSDFDFADYGLEGEGVVNVCHCSNCGADIEYYVRCDDEEGGDE